MYGMIHRAVRQMVLEHKGLDFWTSIERSAAAEPAHFISSVTYDDSITMRILDEAATALGVELNTLLEDFGKYWILFAEHGSFGSILRFTGQDIETFVSNLDRMHRTIQDVMQQSRMPSFTIIRKERGNLLVAYTSERKGLEPFVIGLFLGLFMRFDLTGTVNLVANDNKSSLFQLIYQ
jgi:Haem-NO-binding